MPSRIAREKLRPFAKFLRREETKAETHLWLLLRSGKLAGFKFRRQHPLPPYIIDFICLKSKVIVELDGDSHIGKEVKDARRDEWLTACGHVILRFGNLESQIEEEAAMEKILKSCQRQVKKV